MKTSIILFTSFLLAVSFLSLSLAFKSIAKGSSKDYLQQKQFLCEYIYREVHAELEKPILVSKMMASDEFLLDFLKNEGELKDDEETMKKYLCRIKDDFGFAQATLISAATHRYYRDDEMHKIINPLSDTHDVWFYWFESKGKQVVVNSYKSPHGIKNSTIYVNYAIEDKGKFLGVASPSIATTKVINLFAELEKKYKVKIDVVTTDGTVLIDSNYDEMAVANLANYISNGKNNVFMKTGKSGFFATYYDTELDWYVVIRSEQGEKEKSPLELFNRIALLIFALDMLLLFAAQKAFKEKKAAPISATAQTDSLTSLPNRNYFKEQFGERGLFNTIEYKCMAVLDIDYFKEANDNLNGDEMLLFVVQELSALISDNGVIFRWGGDEFVVLFKTSEEIAYNLLKTFCKNVAEKKAITVSVGLTTINLFDTIKTNYHRAARYCYMVKELGGNGVKKD